MPDWQMKHFGIDDDEMVLLTFCLSATCERSVCLVIAGKARIQQLQLLQDGRVGNRMLHLLNYCPNSSYSIFKNLQFLYLMSLLNAQKCLSGKDNKTNIPLFYNLKNKRSF